MKFIAVKIDNYLNFNEHISNICKKANVKLHALVRIAHLMKTDKFRLLVKAFIESQFAFCPLVWVCHSRTLNNKINKLNERALRLVYKDRNLSFTQLLDMNKSISVHHRNLQKLATEMFKVKHDLSPRFMHTIFASSKNPYNLRYDSSFKTENIRTVTYGSETLSYRGPEL